MQSFAETCVRFDAAHLSINLVSEIAVPMFTTLSKDGYYDVDCSTFVTYTFCPYQPVVYIAVLGYIVIEGYKGLYMVIHGYTWL